MSDDNVFPFASPPTEVRTAPSQEGAGSAGDAIPYPFGATLDEMDTESFFNIRAWLRNALEAQGAKQIGAGIGLGQADIDIELDGHRYNVSIRPLK